ncbi:hypothetical protein BG015_009374, partial [Linnemannia schmuckeri]
PQTPQIVRLGQGHAHVYRKEAGTITSYPLTDVASSIPTGIVTKTLEGLSLQHIIPGVHPQTSQLYDIDTSSVSSTAPLRPYQFVTSQYMASSVTLPTTTVLNTFQFGISLTAEGHIRGINLSGNATSSTFGQTANTGLVYVDAPYSSEFSSSSSSPKEDPPDSITPRKLAAILAGLALAMILALLTYRLWREKKNRKLRAIAAEASRLEPARYQPPYCGQGQGQAIELTTRAVPYNQQPQRQHRQNQPSARHDGPDAPPPYSA